MSHPLQRRGLVLVVDDDARSARVLARLLHEDGYETEVVLDGAAAIHRLTRAPVPDALVTDFKIPYADGVAVAAYARSLSAKIPVVLVTAYPELVERMTALLSPRVRVLSKPLDYGDLTLALDATPASAPPPPPQS